MEMAEYPVDKVIFRDSRGRLVRSLENFNQLMTGRHGYPIVFFERRMLIQILYDKIQDKSKVLTSQRVQTVHTSRSHVTVTTKEGQSYKGDIVVGADGIHSIVRRQMWEEARKTDPSWIDPSEENALPATYACMFGISEGVPGVEKGTLSSVFNEKFSYLIPSRPGAKTYWFLVRNLGKTMYGPDILRFTKQEEVTLVKKHWDDQITPTVRFSDLYKNKTSSVYTSLPEYVYKRWYFQRIMTIGDSCHKFEPLTGQGGNSAIDTAAALTNHLTAALRSNPCQSLSTVDISSAFEKVQRQRDEPVSLDMIPIPRRPREIPFYDELFRVPATRGITGLLLYVGYLLIAFIAFRLLFVATAANGTWALVRQAVRDRSITMGGLEVPLRRVFTGFRSVDRILQSLVTIFLPVVAGPSRPEQALQLLYFLSSMLPLISILTVEGYRRRNKWTLLSSPSLWAVLYQLRGIGFIAPFYFMASTFITGQISYFSWTTRSLPESTAKAILPAVAAGYILPTMLLFFPIDHAQTRHCLLSENLSLTRLFFPVDSFAPVASLADGASTFLKNDFLLVTASTFVWCWVSVWDLHRVGISNVSPLSALAGLLAGFAGIGPGATAAAIWFWREQIMSQREFRQRS
ncbi:zeaxanthin epoxidase [Aspergillus arachidicola]|uniref:Zeaxanthin epoxidase n=1 Tax=Aspergillus arachidicola TaxID=656916 RepID=A0A2G7G2T0_9EURO|nr:zeaxanthin epoxidase [Aspergillus arachidicola]